MEKFLKGLSSQEVEESRLKHGSNHIEEAPPETFWGAFKESFEDPMIRILCVISAIMIVMYFFGFASIYEPIGTLVAIIIVATVSASTSVASDKKYNDLKHSIKPDDVKVVRNGKVELISVEDVVVGDIVLLQNGDKIPADGVLIHGELKVNNSSLNGETEECKKTAAPDGFLIPDQITGDTFVDEHSLFKGAVLYSGEGYMEIQKVGMQTMMGKMAEDMKTEEPDSPLKVKLNKLAKQISTFGYVGAICISVVYIIYFILQMGGLAPFFAQGVGPVLNQLLEAVTLAIVIIVCAVPEGLPLMIALVLMQNTGKLLKNNVLVRKAIGIETAGSLNILFSDKTGTITKGHLEVVDFYDGNGDVHKAKGNNDRISYMLGTAIAKNTSAMFDGNTHDIIGGNATDKAVLTFLGEDAFTNDFSDVTVNEKQEFNSANKFSQANVACKGFEKGVTVYKGAPEKLLAKAKSYMKPDGTTETINLDKVNETINMLATKAMRVLAFGYSASPMTESSINDDLVLIGFVGIRDDVRPEAKDAIREVQEAGIQVVMVTGDRLETAIAIAKDASLLAQDAVMLTEENKNEMLQKYEGSKTSTTPDGLALDSNMLAKLTDDELKTLISGIRVIARALPTDKSRLVKICQEMELVCGMTGV